jgi:hypothetical protein
MQFAVPQFTDVEDKLIGPLTLKQFLITLGFGGIIFFFWSLFGIGFIFYLIAIPTAGIGAYVTFKKFNGRPFFTYLIPLIGFLTSPKVMVFKREEALISFSSKQIKKPEPKTARPEDFEPTQSRLKKLAYLLDQKSEEEKEIISEAKRFEEPQARPTPPQKAGTQSVAAPQEKPSKLQQMNQRLNLSKDFAPFPTSTPTAPAPQTKTASRRPIPPKAKKAFDPSEILKPKI